MISGVGQIVAGLLQLVISCIRRGRENHNFDDAFGETMEVKVEAGISNVLDLSNITDITTDELNNVNTKPDSHHVDTIQHI